MPPARRIASVNPFSESPGIPYTRRVPDAFNVATITSATLEAIIHSLSAAPRAAKLHADISRLAVEDEVRKSYASDSCDETTVRFSRQALIRHGTSRKQLGAGR
jgi:hypothetical protein